MFHQVYPCWDGLHHAALTGEPGVNKIFGQPLFDYIGTHPDLASIFDAGMAVSHGHEPTGMLEAYDFSAIHLFADIGGGQVLSEHAAVCLGLILQPLANRRTGPLEPWEMWTAETLERRILWGLDEATAGRPRPLRVRGTPSRGAPRVTVVDYLKGYPCFWLTPLAFYGEASGALLEGVGHCRRSGKPDEIEVCLRQALEPGRSLWFDGLMEEGFAHTEDDAGRRRAVFQGGCIVDAEHGSSDFAGKSRFATLSFLTKKNLMTVRDLVELVEHLQAIDHRPGHLDGTEVQAVNVLRLELLQVSLAVRRVVDVLATDLEEGQP